MPVKTVVETTLQTDEELSPLAPLVPFAKLVPFTSPGTRAAFSGCCGFGGRCLHNTCKFISVMKICSAPIIRVHTVFIWFYFRTKMLNNTLVLVDLYRCWHSCRLWGHPTLAGAKIYCRLDPGCSGENLMEYCGGKYGSFCMVFRCSPRRT